MFMTFFTKAGKNKKEQNCVVPLRAGNKLIYIIKDSVFQIDMGTASPLEPAHDRARLGWCDCDEKFYFPTCGNHLLAVQNIAKMMAHCCVNLHIKVEEVSQEKIVIKFY